VLLLSSRGQGLTHAPARDQGSVPAGWGACSFPAVHRDRQTDEPRTLQLAPQEPALNRRFPIAARSETSYHETRTYVLKLPKIPHGRAPLIPYQTASPAYYLLTARGVPLWRRIIAPLGSKKSALQIYTAALMVMNNSRVVASVTPLYREAPLPWQLPAWCCHRHRLPGR
jgi:hypothetical protein